METIIVLQVSLVKKLLLSVNFTYVAVNGYI